MPWITTPHARRISPYTKPTVNLSCPMLTSLLSVLRTTCCHLKIIGDMVKPVFGVIIPSVGIPVVPIAMTAGHRMCINERLTARVKRRHDGAVLKRAVTIPVVYDDIPSIRRRDAPPARPATPRYWRSNNAQSCSIPPSCSSTIPVGLRTPCTTIPFLFYQYSGLGLCLQRGTGRYNSCNPRQIPQTPDSRNPTNGRHIIAASRS